MVDFSRIMNLKIPSDRTLRETIAAYSIPAAAKVYEEVMESVDRITRDMNVRNRLEATVALGTIPGC